MEDFEAVITTLGVEVPTVPRVAALVRRELTVAPVSLNDPFPKKFKVYVEKPDGGFVVPLHWARAALEPFGARFVDCRGPGDDARLEFRGSLRADLRQLEAVAAVRRAWDAGGGAMLCLPPGFGTLATPASGGARGGGGECAGSDSDGDSNGDSDVSRPQARRRARCTWRPRSRRRRWWWCTRRF